MPFEPPDKSYGVNTESRRFAPAGEDYGIENSKFKKPEPSDFGIGDAEPTPGMFRLTQDTINAWRLVQDNPNPPSSVAVAANSVLKVGAIVIVAGGGLVGLFLHGTEVFYLAVLLIPLFIPFVVSWMRGDFENASSSNRSGSDQRRIYRAHEFLRRQPAGLEDQIQLYLKAVNNHRLRRAEYEAAASEFERLQQCAAREERRWWLGLDGLAFETQLGKLFNARGYEVEKTSTTADGGVDLILTKENERTVVQCKAHKKPVSIGTARELSAARADFEADRAILAALGGVTGPVTEYLQDKPIEIITIDEIVEMAKVTPSAWQGKVKKPSR